MRRWPFALALLSAVTAGGCHGAGPYGHAATYAPTADETAAADSARPYDPVMAQRDPEAFRQGKLSLFGIVTGRAPGAGGAAALTLSVRRLEDRNLCVNARDESTCRVTVTDRDFGVVHALVALLPEDDTGEKSVGVGSLVRIVGRLGEDTSASDGAQTVRASFYRHWPRHAFVTNANADAMRQ